MDERVRRRILQVREQEKILAAQKCASFRKHSASLLQELSSDLKVEWEVEKLGNIAELEATIKRKSMEVGLSHANAAEEDENWLQQMKVMKHRLLQQEINGHCRSVAAGKFARTAQLETSTAVLSRFNTISRVQQIEKDRAKKAAASARRSRAANPTTPIDFTQAYRSAHEAKTGYTNYDFTTSRYHNDFAAVRADVQQKPSTAGVLAAIVAREHESQLAQKAESGKRHAATAQMRYNKAISGTAMDLKRAKLCSALDQLRIDDRKRKHENALLHAKQNRATFFNIDTHEFEKEFVKKFSIESSYYDYPAIGHRRSPPRSPSIDFAINP